MLKKCRNVAEVNLIALLRSNCISKIWKEREANLHRKGKKTIPVGGKKLRFQWGRRRRWTLIASPFCLRLIVHPNLVLLIQPLFSVSATFISFCIFSPINNYFLVVSCPLPRHEKTPRHRHAYDCLMIHQNDVGTCEASSSQYCPYNIGCQIQWVHRLSFWATITWVFDFVW